MRAARVDALIFVGHLKGANKATIPNLTYTCIQVEEDFYKYIGTSKAV